MVKDAQRPVTGALTVSVVISAYTLERWDALCDAVASVEAQTRPAQQIIVSVDHNPEMLERARERWSGSSVVVVESTGIRGLSGARNTGVAAATGDIVAFIDDDAAAEPDWLARLAPVFDDPAVASAGGSLLPVWLEERPAWFPSEFNWVVGCSYTGMPTATAEVRNAIGANMALRRDTLNAVGGFTSGLGRAHGLPMGCEDTEIAIRVRQRAPGIRVVYEPRAQVRHLVPAGRGTWTYFFRRCWAEGRSKALLTDIVGRHDGLESERTYTTRTLPRGVARGLRDAAGGDASGVGRAAAILSGLAVTVAGYGRGTLGRGPRPA